MATLLWIIAVVLVVSGIFALVRGRVLWGIVLIVVGLLVGPGGVASFTEPLAASPGAGPTEWPPENSRVE